MKKMILGVLLSCVVANATEVYATFVVEAKRSANLAFIASGTVKSVMVDTSSIIKKGDILAELKNDDIKAALNIAKISLKFAKKEYNRQMRAKSSLSASRLESYTYKYENAKAQVIYQRALLDKTILKAPFDAVVFNKALEVGDVVSAALIRTVLKVQSPEARKLILSFDQKYWRDVKVGQKFTYILDGDTTKKQGTISKIYPAVSASDMKMKAEVEVDGLMVGLFGDGTIEVSSEQ